jgi:hypothetical protein
MNNLKEIRSFFGRLRGNHSERYTHVTESKLYECIKCKQIFQTKQQGESHECTV